VVSDGAGQMNVARAGVIVSGIVRRRIAWASCARCATILAGIVAAASHRAANNGRLAPCAAQRRGGCVRRPRWCVVYRRT